MARKTIREISRLFNAEKVSTPGIVAGLKLSAVGSDKGLRFIGTVSIGANHYDMASDTGKLKIFTDVDSFLKQAAKCVEKGSGVYTVDVDTLALLASSVPSDMVSYANAQMVRLNKTKLGQQALITTIDDQLGLMVGWESGNAAQQTKKAETQAQRACVVTDIAAIDTEVARLAVIAAG